MPHCKDCSHFKEIESDERGYCYGHVASLQKVSPDRDIVECPINKFRPKE